MFISFAPGDATLARELREHLSLLARIGVIEPLDRQAVQAGDIRREAILSRMDRAALILLLVSAHYLASDECFEVECKHAMKRHASRRACVIPVRLRGCDWTGAPFAGLSHLPRDGRPVTAYRNRDRPWIEIVAATRSAAEALRTSANPEPERAPVPVFDEAMDSPPGHGTTERGSSTLHPQTRILFRESITDMAKRKVAEVSPTNPLAFARLQDGARLTVEAERDSRVEGARVKRKAACRELLVCLECTLFLRFDRVRAAAKSAPAWMVRLAGHVSGESLLWHLRNAEYPSLERIGEWLVGPRRLPEEVASGLTRSLGIPPGLEPEITVAAQLQGELVSSADVPVSRLERLEWLAKCLLDRKVHERAADTHLPTPADPGQRG